MNYRNLSLRKVESDDIDLLFRWANDESVRKNAFNQNKITYADHQHWFNEKLKDENCYIYILLKNKNPIGQIRVEVNEGVGEIDYSIEKNERGNGYGTFLLHLLIDKIKTNNLKINKLIGEVKRFNIASKKTFLKANFNKSNKNEYILFYYNLN